MDEPKLTFYNKCTLRVYITTPPLALKYIFLQFFGHDLDRLLDGDDKTSFFRGGDDRTSFFRGGDDTTSTTKFSIFNEFYSTFINCI